MNFQNLKKNATLQTVTGFKYAPRLDTSAIQGWAQLSSSLLLGGKKHRGPGFKWLTHTNSRGQAIFSWPPWVPALVSIYSTPTHTHTYI